MIRLKYSKAHKINISMVDAHKAGLESIVEEIEYNLNKETRR